MPEKMLVEFDKAGAEWVVVAYASGDARMIYVVQSGKSPHVETGKLITQATEELILKEHKVIGAKTDPVEIEELRREHVPEIFSADLLFLPRIFSIRQMSKKCNHALNYYMQAREFSQQTEMEERDCKKVVDLYTRTAYPGVPLWWESIKRDLRQNNRTIYNCFGRKRRFLEEWGNDLFKQAYAHLPQSTIVDMVNGGLVLYWDDEHLVRLWDFLAQVHDSLVFQVSVGDWKTIAKGCVKIALDYMNPECEYGGRKFRVGTDMKIGKSWGQMHPVPLSRDIDKVAADLRRTWEGLRGQKAAA